MKTIQRLYTFTVIAEQEAQERRKSCGKWDIQEEIQEELNKAEATEDQTLEQVKGEINEIHL